MRTFEGSIDQARSISSLMVCESGLSDFYFIVPEPHAQIPLVSGLQAIGLVQSITEKCFRLSNSCETSEDAAALS